MGRGYKVKDCDMVMMSLFSCCRLSCKANGDDSEWSKGKGVRAVAVGKL